MRAAPTPQSAMDAVNKLITQLPEKIKLWRFVGKMAIDQLNKKVLDEVDNYSTRKPRDPVVARSTTTTQVVPVIKAEAKVSKMGRSGSTKLPIPGYENMSALQIIELLTPLKRSELITINKFETANRARKTILSKLKTMIDEDQ